MTAVLFAGQGADLHQMAPVLVREFPAVRELVTLAAEIVRVPVDDLWSRAGRRLEDTAIYQPVLVALSLGVYATLQRQGVTATVTAGHSLGEVCAWSAAGVISAETAVRLAAARGSMMASCAAARPGGMIALMEHGEDAAHSILSFAAPRGDIHLAAMNAPDEFVFGGDVGALRSLAARYASRHLHVAGAWHGPRMQPAAEAFRTLLEAERLMPLRVPVVTNASGEVVTDAAVMPVLLSDQLTRPVNWIKTLATLGELGVRDVVLCGPGKMLKGLFHRNGITGMVLHPSESPQQLATTVEALTA